MLMSTFFSRLSDVQFLADPSGFILFPLVIHSFDLVISSIGILSIRSTRDSSVNSPREDPMAILQKGYSVTIVLAVITFGAVMSSRTERSLLLFLIVSFLCNFIVLFVIILLLIMLLPSLQIQT